MPPAPRRRLGRSHVPRRRGPDHRAGELTEAFGEDTDVALRGDLRPQDRVAVADQCGGHVEVLVGRADEPVRRVDDRAEVATRAPEGETEFRCKQQQLFTTLFTSIPQKARFSNVHRNQRKTQVCCPRGGSELHRLEKDPLR